MRSGAWVWTPIGIVAALVGLLPWMVHGGELPPQNLAATATLQSGPRVLLPFSQYAVVTIAGLLVEGGLLAGLLARLPPGRRVGWQRALLVLGLLVVQVAAVVQTAVTTREELAQRTESAVYVAVLVVGSALAVLLGAIIALLTSARSRAAVVVGVALAAPLLGSWAQGFVALPLPLGAGGPGWVVAALTWLPSVAVGAAVAWSGIRGVGRTVAALVGLIAVWAGPALVGAIAAAAGTRADARDPGSMVRLAGLVVVTALGEPVALVPVLIAVVVAAIGLLLRAVAGRSTAAAA